MGDRKHVLGSVAAFFAVIIAGWLTLAGPSYRQASEIAQQVDDLRARSASLDELLADVASMRSQLRQAQQTVDQRLKVIPESPDLAELMLRLSMPVDKVTVLDQTFTRGSAYEATITGGNWESLPVPPMTMPLTIDLIATFDSVFAVLQATESINRLVRVSTVRLSCDRSETNDARHTPVLNASIGLEAIYVPPNTSSTRTAGVIPDRLLASSRVRSHTSDGGQQRVVRGGGN